MELPIERVSTHTKEYDNDVLKVCYDFTKLIHKELGDIIKAVVLFGSATKKDDPHDIDVLIIVDDIQILFNQEMQVAYRVVVENCVKAVSKRLHVTTLRFTNFWEYVRTSDPLLVTVLRDGMALIDTGFFAPLQILLRQGRIRPTQESIWAYYSRAPQLLTSSKAKILFSMVDLYWAVIDAAHAALMSAAVVPKTPEHVPDLIREHFVDKGLLDARYADIVETFYNLQKDIQNRKIERISGARADELHGQADDFVKRMRLFLN